MHIITQYSCLLAVIVKWNQAQRCLKQNLHTAGPCRTAQTIPSQTRQFLVSYRGVKTISDGKGGVAAGCALLGLGDWRRNGAGIHIGEIGLRHNQRSKSQTKYVSVLSITVTYEGIAGINLSFLELLSMHT